ncbi:metal-sensitive transcriptional regulator [uncultured Arthrobacter sp.]|uniref:metal-sensitive transcriptional regulator n=1 Tax=uncultured Arthrobacter sp. TaxID=114050 RepID=UPI003216CF19
MSSAISLPGVKPGPDAAMRRTINRLKRAQGQLGALIAAVESGSDCRSVVTQLSAVRGALDKAGFELISSAMRECIADVPEGMEGAAADDAAGQKLTLEEIRGLFLRLT